MKSVQTRLAFAVLALVGFANIAAHADELDIPASAAQMGGDPMGSACVVQNGMYGITSEPVVGFCDFIFPLTIPAGRTIQQITVLHGTLGPPPSYISANLTTLNTSAFTSATEFQWGSTSQVPSGLQATRLMLQTKFGYPDAFVTQVNTTYQVVVHVEQGAFVDGLQVTYQYNIIL